MWCCSSSKYFICLVFPDYSSVLIFADAWDISPNLKLSNCIHAFTVLLKKKKNHRSKSFASYESFTRQHISKQKPYSPLPLQERTWLRTAKPTHEERFTSSQPGQFWTSFPCSFVQLQNWILQLTLARGKKYNSAKISFEPKYYPRGITYNDMKHILFCENSSLSSL